MKEPASKAVINSSPLNLLFSEVSNPFVRVAVRVDVVTKMLSSFIRTVDWKTSGLLTDFAGFPES